jgi:L-cysteine:1D-myo-inositol 2-amino-2-deoxy-alpha-D-glucopyranoside ligase
MSRQYLGNRIDIHGGGTDLIYPHHECEIAQNRSVEGGSSVRIWSHAALVDYQGHKMSKSRGNIVLARDVIGRWDPRALRLAVMTYYHPRRGMQWQDEYLDEATDMLARLIAAVALPAGVHMSEYARDLGERLDDDLDLPGAVRVLMTAVRAVERGAQTGSGDSVSLADMAAMLGVDVTRPITVDPSQPAISTGDQPPSRKPEAVIEPTTHPVQS